MPNHYESVTEVEQLPRPVHSPSHVRENGHAVLLGEQWFWFSKLEPAYVFARAARMASGIGDMCIKEAATEVKFSERLGRDVFALYTLAGSGVDQSPECDRDLVSRFVAGLNPRSVSWTDPS
ncbi:hypothetical protein [Microcella flavibacter]|uniref:hypothetical protein n=1 Tax=Microcella flavibacter TaxID=1804990 RepID=UPI00145698C5|nr:hypothetical protein [Microcella flavibacter]